MATNWFKAKQKPVRIGVYPTRFTVISTGKVREGYTYWNGRAWNIQHETVENAAKSISCFGACQNKEWWGFAEKQG